MRDKPNFGPLQEQIIVRTVAELKAELLPLLQAELRDCIIISTSRAAGMCEMNSQACLRMLEKHNLIVDLGLRNQGVRLSALNAFLQERQGHKTNRNPYHKRAPKRRKDTPTDEVTTP